jgi:hypothetical protein
MSFGLLSLALLGTTLSVVSAAETLPARTSCPNLQIGDGRTSLSPLRVGPRLPSGNSKPDCIDDTENSDELSSARERAKEFGGSMSLIALAQTRTRLEPGSPTPPRGISLPLFYAFCSLLI